MVGKAFWNDGFTQEQQTVYEQLVQRTETLARGIVTRTRLEIASPPLFNTTQEALKKRAGIEVPKPIIAEKQETPNELLKDNEIPETESGFVQMYHTRGQELFKWIVEQKRQNAARKV